MSCVGFRLCVSIAAWAVTLLPSPVDPVAEVVTAPWNPESPLAGEIHTLHPCIGMSVQSSRLSSMSDRALPQHVALLLLQREGLAAAWL